MTLNEKIIAAVTPIVAVCVPDLLVTEPGETPPEEYCTFDYTQTAGLAGDDGTDVGLARVQLHYLAPLKASTVAKRRATQPSRRRSPTSIFTACSATRRPRRRRSQTCRPSVLRRATCAT